MDEIWQDFEQLSSHNFTDLRQVVSLQLFSTRVYDEKGLSSGFAIIPPIDIRGHTKDTLFRPATYNYDHGGSSYWVHIPFTNGPLLKAIAGVNTHASFAFIRGMSSIVPDGSGLAFLEPGCRSQVMKADEKFKRICVSIVFPVITLRTVKDVATRDTWREETGVLLPFVENSSRLGIHFAHTLDEAYYPGLHEQTLKDRNGDQVVSKQYEDDARGRRSVRRGIPRDDGSPVVMISQLWLFRMHNGLLTAFETPAGNRRAASLFTRRSVTIEDEDGNRMECSTWDPPENILTSLEAQMILIISRHLDDFGLRCRDERTNRSFPAPLDLYERAIMSTLRRTNDYVSRRARSSAAQRNEEEHIVHDIFDIREELVMIKDVLTRQYDLLKDIDKQITGCYEQIHQVERYLRRVKKLSLDAERIHQMMDSLFNLKRANASFEDARSSIAIGVAALGFAFVTIIFTPLGFMVSLLGLESDLLLGNKHQFRNETDTTAYSDGYIGGLIFGVEALTLVITGVVVWRIADFFELFPKEIPRGNVGKASAGSKSTNSDTPDESKKAATPARIPRIFGNSTAGEKTNTVTGSDIPSHERVENPPGPQSRSRSSPKQSPSNRQDHAVQMA